VSKRIFHYLWQLLSWRLFALMAGASFLLMVFNLLELQRRFAHKSGYALHLILWAGILKLPQALDLLFPFMLFSAVIFSMLRLNQSHEITALQTTGVSAWSLLKPFLAFVLVLGLARLFFFQPLIVQANRLSKVTEARLFHCASFSENCTVLKSGVWIRKNLDQETFLIGHLPKLLPNRKVLHNLSIYVFQKPYRFQKRFFAKRAIHKAGKLHLEDSWLFDKDQNPTFSHSRTVNYPFSIEDFIVQNLDPKSISVWSFPDLLKTMENAGLKTDKYRMVWYHNFFLIFEWLALTLLAFALGLQLRGRDVPLRLTGSFTLLLVLGFLSQLFYALGEANFLSLSIATFAPVGITLLCGVAPLFFLEEGTPLLTR
jgi:lipopolysaccharide export LptBFGC system permease protein LptF